MELRGGGCEPDTGERAAEGGFHSARQVGPRDLHFGLAGLRRSFQRRPAVGPRGCLPGYECLELDTKE